MSFSILKRQIGEENRRFNPAWTDKYLFIYHQVRTPNQCVYSATSALQRWKIIMSEDTTLEKHAAFRTNFPEGCHERAAIIQSLTASYNRSCTTMKRTCTAQERATKKRPFTDSETVKDCMLAVVDEVLTDDKVKTSVTSAIKQVWHVKHSRHRCLRDMVSATKQRAVADTKGSFMYLCDYFLFTY